MRILLVTDAWYPQVNGVVRAVSILGHELSELGHEVRYITPQDFRSIPCPTYSEIRLALLPRRKVARLITDFQPEAVHIATEGPLGWAARGFCRKHKIPFTTTFHTRFPEYIEARTKIPQDWIYKIVARFHNAAEVTAVSTTRLGHYLQDKGIQRVTIWQRGVDTKQFRPLDPVPLDYPRPILMYVGRLAVEKNVEAFLKTEHAGTKVLVGDGPQREELERKYPDAVFLGAKKGDELVRHYCAADVFCFPSRTDTLGFVMLEALACGVPVAAFPVMGPLDVIGDAPVGAVDEDLSAAIDRALTMSRQECRRFAEQFSWHESAKQFARMLSTFPPENVLPRLAEDAA